MFSVITTTTTATTTTTTTMDNKTDVDNNDFKDCARGGLHVIIELFEFEFLAPIKKSYQENGKI